ncbi:hypothetical protein, partial [Actinoplanes sp. NPDC051411]|uniref:hypothetical protein n=1 Tax=Actinoplanes sp. NPDC051411 TaxID=3155522 RepID=UPI00341CEEEB
MALRSSAWSALLTAVALVAACGPGAPAPAVSASAVSAPAVSAPAASVGVASPAADPGRKVMVIVEENHGYRQVIGDPDAPYLNRLAGAYGTTTRYDAGYPAHCPSLAAYILMTSG